MNSAALKVVPIPSPVTYRGDVSDALATDSSYSVRLASTAAEVAAALRLRYEVFNQEMGIPSTGDDSLEFDQFDLRCKHLIAIERSTGRVIGTYRVNAIAATESIDKFYSYGEFTLETLPESVLRNGAEVGRACVAPEHRGTRALFLLWKGLARYLASEGKRYLFGCCSIFTRDLSVGKKTYQKLLASGHVSSELQVTPRSTIVDDVESVDEPVLPPLFEMYLRLGAKVCGPPTHDAHFGSIDFLVVLDFSEMNDRNRRKFLA